jgi:hypothetical protein
MTAELKPITGMRENVEDLSGIAPIDPHAF